MLDLENIIFERISKESYFSSGFPSGFIRIHNEEGTIDNEAALYDSMTDYVSDACFDYYCSERRTTLNPEDLPEYVITSFQVCEDSNFSIGEEIEIDGVKYTEVNFGEDDISFLKSDSIDDIIYAVLERGEIKHEVLNDDDYEYIEYSTKYEYKESTKIFETEDDAQKYIDHKKKDEEA